jgi:hypothetical protein
MSTHQQVHKSKTMDNAEKQQPAHNHTPLTRLSHPAAILRRAGTDPGSITHVDVLHLQRTLGNKAVGRLLSGDARRQEKKETSNGMAAGHINDLMNGEAHDTSMYRREITRFQQENPPDKIARLQGQILEPRKSVDISRRSNSKIMRACGCCGGGGGRCVVDVNHRPTYNVLDAGSVSNNMKNAAFTMSAGFENNPGNNIYASCCEIRHMIRWRPNANAAPTHAGFQPQMNFQHNTWYEDRSPVGDRLGHRTDPAHSVNYYDDNDNGNPNMASGNRYHGFDAPGVQATHPGKYDFQLLVIDTCNGNQLDQSAVHTVDWDNIH